MDRRRIPSLDDLRAFETVVRTGSVRAAGDELALTHGAVSRRVSKLAQALGVQLLTPAGRGIQPTADGARLARVTGQALNLIAETIDGLGVRRPEPTVLLSCEGSIAMRWLISRLSRFQDAHPELAVHLSVGGGRSNLNDRGSIIALRRRDFDLDPRWTVTPLFREEIGPVMAPRLRDAFEEGNFIGLASRTRPDAWGDWSRVRPDSPHPREIRYFDHHFLMAEAAAAGMGVALCPRIVACDDITSARLVTPRGFVEDGSTYVAIQTDPSAGNDAMAVMLDWLITETATFPRP